MTNGLQAGLQKYLMAWFAVGIFCAIWSAL